jgi:flagellar motility protein MotE (MotC chaperone)
MKGKHVLHRNKALSGNSGKYMRKKWELIIILLITIKVLLVGSLFLRVDPHSPSFFFNHEAAAQEEQKAGKEEGNQNEQSSDEVNLANSDEESIFKWDIELLKALQEREANVYIREEGIHKEEERLQTLRRQIQKKLDSLARVETRIAELIKTKQVMEDEKINQLAKVFESTPPEQAGPMLTKLDVDIAAQIIVRMNGRKAGKIWGYVDPDRAVTISKKVAQLKPKVKTEK